MSDSEAAAGARRPRRIAPPAPSGLSGRCLLAGIGFGCAGAAWIVGTHRWPERALHYHVPLAVAFGAFAAWLALAPLGRARLPLVLATLLALAAVAARLFLSWPLSGH